MRLPTPRELEEYTAAAAAWGAGTLSDVDYQAFLERHHARLNPPPPKRPAKLDQPPPDPSLRGYSRLPEQIRADRRLCWSATKLIMCLVQLARGRGRCTAYVDQLADMIGTSRRTVRYAQKRLEACGYIIIQRRRTGSLNDANAYQLTAAALPDATPAKRRKETRRKVVRATVAAIARGRRGGAKNCTPRGTPYGLPPPTSPQGGGRTRRRAGARPLSPGPSPVDGGGEPESTGPPPSPD